jgi:hypothetical protein
LADRELARARCRARCSERRASRLFAMSSIWHFHPSLSLCDGAGTSTVLSLRVGLALVRWRAQRTGKEQVWCAEKRRGIEHAQLIDALFRYRFSWTASEVSMPFCDGCCRHMSDQTRPELRKNGRHTHNLDFEVERPTLIDGDDEHDIRCHLPGTQKMCFETERAKFCGTVSWTWRVVDSSPVCMIVVATREESEGVRRRHVGAISCV